MFTESIIRHHGYKTGLFNSPHIVTVRERIRLNGYAISEDLFSKYFWICWDALQDKKNNSTGPYSWSSNPGWFQFLTLLGFKIFQEEQVDCAIVEVGIGGLFDSTNILTSSVVCSGISFITYDHTELLGDTLQEIAYQKAGIIKQRRPIIISMPQTDTVLSTIIDKARLSYSPIWLAHKSIQSYLYLSTLHTDEYVKAISRVHNFYFESNVTLAIALADLWFSHWSTKKNAKPHPLYSISSHSGQDYGPTNLLPTNRGSPSTLTHVDVTQMGAALCSANDFPNLYPVFELSRQYLEGIAYAHTPGRMQVINTSIANCAKHVKEDQQTDRHIRVTYFIDGAHTPDSILSFIKWYNERNSRGNGRYQKENCSKVMRILIFNCKKPRDPRVFIEILVKSILNKHIPMDLIIFGFHRLKKSMEPLPGDTIGFNHEYLYNPDELVRIWKETIDTVEANHVKINILDAHKNSVDLKGIDCNDLNEGLCQPEGLLPKISTASTIDEALIRVMEFFNQHNDRNKVNQNWEEIEILVTGSLYLGSILDWLNYSTTEAMPQSLMYND